MAKRVLTNEPGLKIGVDATPEILLLNNNLHIGISPTYVH